MLNALKVGCALTFILGAGSAFADCPGNPDALGTSRVLAIDPNEYSQIGTINYEETLPLKDHEVVHLRRWALIASHGESAGYSRGRVCQGNVLHRR